MLRYGFEQDQQRGAGKCGFSHVQFCAHFLPHLTLARGAAHTQR